VLVESGIPRDEPGVTSGLAAQVVFRTYGSLKPLDIHTDVWYSSKCLAGPDQRGQCWTPEPDGMPSR
jgi:hypothetical protein